MFYGLVCVVSLGFGVGAVFWCFLLCFVVGLLVMYLALYCYVWFAGCEGVLG